MPHACEQARQTLAGLPGHVRLADTKQTREGAFQY